MKKGKIIGLILFVLILSFIMLSMGETDATIASRNLSTDADQFKIYRRVVFYNGITDTYILQVEGYCSIAVDVLDGQLELTVKTDDGKYLKHYLGLSDNVTYFCEQLDASKVSTARYKVIFKPSAIIPEIDIE